jgi:hypothetical protein
VSNLRFRVLGFTSEVMIDAQWHRLNTQRPDQDWVNQLLTDSYHAEHQRRTREPQYGAVNGDFAILIGLIAFSCHAGNVERALKYCIRPVHGNDGGWRAHGRPRAQGCKSMISHFSVSTSYNKKRERERERVRILLPIRTLKDG